MDLVDSVGGLTGMYKKWVTISKAVLEEQGGRAPRLWA